MKPGLKLAAAIAVGAFGATIAAAAPGGRTFEVQNDTGETQMCSVKADGSSRSESMRLKAGVTWTKDFGGSKARRFRCEGAYSKWHRIEAGGRYKLVKVGSGLIAVRPASTR